MPEKVDLYNAAYARYDADVYRAVRLETYGEDLGQTSWVTREESAEIPRLLRLERDSNVLEIGSGSGRYAIQIAESTGCCVLGIDLNAHGIQTANQLAAGRHLENRVRFEVCDASKRLPFADAEFDAIFSNDVLCHLPGRLALMRELFRVLQAGRRLAFSDALVIGGLISHEEIAARSSVGYYLFSPPGENERLLQEAGFHVISATDTSQSAASISQRWHDAREKRREPIIAIEGKENFEGLQKFFSCVHKVSGEGRLRRYLYVAEKPGTS